MFEGFLRPFQSANCQFDFGSGRNEDLDEIDGSGANAIDTIEYKTDERRGNNTNG
jgi:hypothetical protein